MNNKVNISLSVYHAMTGAYVFNGFLNNFFHTLPLVQNIDLYLGVYPSRFLLNLKEQVEGNTSLLSVDILVTTLQVSWTTRLSIYMSIDLYYYSEFSPVNASV